MRWLFIFAGCLLLNLGVFAEKLEYHKVYTPQEGMSAEEIMKIMYHNKYSLFARDYQQTGEVLYVDPSGFTRKRVWKRQRIVKAGQEGISYKDLVVMTYPTELKGLAVLTWTYEDPQKDQNVWLWIPSLKKVRKISASEDDDAFMGSDFTVEEVSTRRFEDESYKLIGSKNFPGYKFEHTGEVKFKDKPCFVVECTPLKPHWYYSKRIVWIDKDTGGNIFEEYYDKNGKLFKTLFREWVWTDLGDKKYPSQISLECKDLRTNHRTVILMEDTKYDQDLSEYDFTVKALMRSRW
ncbi:MAG TPA: outer membrane lipoprotein-sorting protein [Candidatus Omnitrophica bacterium]|nr:MAG: hypothetical protein DRP69_03470 [Candidatus Omnitrophota bacterium]RKY44777.1 MAG: hypothetical protein DRP80_01020 [Candidatus Omnitrophota bacterium]HEC68862.1 outer membrane lipoprotein-sorting protein [Candidatus Omnitrophota bacterium]